MADRIIQDANPNKILVPGPPRPLGLVAPTQARSIFSKQLGSGRSVDERKTVIDNLMQEIINGKIHDADIHACLRDDFETWDHKDFLGLSGKCAILKQTLMTHGVYVPDHHHNGGSIRKSITAAATGIR
ncbi:MAG: hypothetical protein SEPTF4163_006546 [Sporothrix epigloea]